MAELQGNPGWMADQEAKELHQAGLELSVNGGDYDAAHREFRRALTVLEEADPWTEDIQLQTSRVTRDDGFTYVRQGLQQSDGGIRSEFFSEAADHLDAAASSTLLLIDFERPRTRRQKELFAEHGATLGLLGRMVVAHQVATDELPRSQRSYLSLSNIRADQKYFGRRYAHHYLRHGSNAYYRVSNAMHGAQAERLNGKPLHMLPWLGRAAVGMGRALVSDHRNITASARTLVGVGRSLRSRSAAAAAVRARP